MVTYREVIAIVQVVFYVPALIAGILLARRHGFGRNAGWILLITFSLLRLIGAVLEIIGLNHPTRQVLTGAIVCISIGLSPLTLMCLGLMSRVNAEIHEPIPKLVYQGLGLGSLVALCLGVYGGTKQAKSNTEDYTQINNDSKIAVVLFTIIFIIAIFMSLVLISRLSIVPRGEKRVLLAVGLSWPFLTIRYLYAIVSDFAQNKNFNSFYGSPTIYLFMAVLMEFIVVVICEVMGFTLQVQSKYPVFDNQDTEMQSGPMLVNSEDSYPTSYPNQESMQYSNGMENPRKPPQPKPKRRAKGPISWLYFQVQDSIRDRD